MTSDTRGVLYMASGSQFIDEAEHSARSVREHMPDLPIAIATDDSVDSDVFDEIIDYDFETEVIGGRKWLLNSTVPPDLSPFDRTLFLDSDTLLRADVSGVFELLDGYDLAISRTSNKPTVDGLPDTWPMLNCGVIAYRDTDAVNDLLDEWCRRYRSAIRDPENDRPVDQPAFNHALYDSDLRWYCLPTEYNVRVPRRGVVSGEIKIVHGRDPRGLETIARDLEQSDKPRVYRQSGRWWGPTHRVYDRGTFRYHAETTISNYGLAKCAKVGIDYLIDRIVGSNRMDKHADLDIG